MNHTVGPWKLNQSAPGEYFISGGDDSYICEIGAPEEDKVIFDARLIESSPDLLKSLKYLVLACDVANERNELPDCFDIAMIQQARAILFKLGEK